MPSGTKINWSKYEELFRNELPNHTLVEFSRKFIPHVSVKAVGKQARKLQVKHKQYCPSPEHKKKIATFITKETPEILLGIRNLVDANSNVKISKELSISVATLCRLMKLHNIKRSKIGLERARIDSSKASIGKIPWNKGKPMSDEFKLKCALNRLKQQHKLSEIQRTFYNILDELAIHYYKEGEKECIFGPWNMDCRIIHNENDFVVEVQGGYIHGLPKNIIKDEAKATYMMRYFPTVPVKYLWEYEFGNVGFIKQKVLEWCNLKAVVQIDFDFSDVSIRTVPYDDARIFVATFHYLEKLTGRILLGAYLGDRLIAVSTWGAPTRIETAQRLNVTHLQCLELRRFVIHDAFHKFNFASWLLARFESMLPDDIKILVSFADPASGHTGNIYKACNWSFDGETEPSYFYVNENGFVMLKKTLYNQAHKLHSSEFDFCETYGYRKVISPPKYRYVKHI